MSDITYTLVHLLLPGDVKQLALTIIVSRDCDLDLCSQRRLDNRFTAMITEMRIASWRHTSHMVTTNVFLDRSSTTWTMFPSLGLHEILQFGGPITGMINSTGRDFLLTHFAPDVIAAWQRADDDSTLLVL